MRPAASRRARPTARPTARRLRPPPRRRRPTALFNSPEAEAIKAEIVAAARSSGSAQYVDGNGGNISYRIGDERGHLHADAVQQGRPDAPRTSAWSISRATSSPAARARTSEILLHLEIYKAVPEAKGVVHCHPPHATAYAITGRVPPTCVIPEYEVFVGRRRALARTRRRGPRRSPRRCCRSSQSTTPCCWRTTASSAGPTR